MEQEYTGEFDMATKERRSSILKKEKPKNTDENNTEHTLKLSRRVSFASSNFIKPFVADPEDNTIWDATYEEQISHTDSTKSSTEKSQNNDFDVFNMSVCGNFNYPFLDPKDIMLDKENIPVRKPFASLTQEDLVNKENIFFQPGVINLKENGINTTTNELISAVVADSKSERSVKVVQKNAAFNNNQCFSKTHHFDPTEGDMDMTMASLTSVQPQRTGILKKKAWNQPCIEAAQITELNFGQSNKRRFCEVRDSIDFSAMIKHEMKRNEDETMEITENLSKYYLQRNEKFQSNQNTILYDPLEGNMEITSALPNESFIQDNGNTNFMSTLPKYDKRLENVNEGTSLFTFAKKVYVEMKCRNEDTTKSDVMEITSVLPVPHCNNLPKATDVTKRESNRSTIVKGYGLNNTKIFEPSVGNMELTTMLDLERDKELTSVLPPTEQNPYDPNDSVSNNINSRRITRVFQPYEGDMEITSLSKSTELLNNSNFSNDIISVDANSTRKIQDFQRSEANMELTSILPSTETYFSNEHISNNINSGRKTQVYQPSEADKVFRSDLPFTEDSRRKTHVFQSYEGDMEFTSVLPFEEQMKNLPFITNGNTLNDTNKTRGGLQHSEVDMEIASILSSAEQLKNSHVLDNETLNSINSGRRTPVFQTSEGDRNLRSVLTSAEQLKNLSFIPNTNSLNDMNNPKKDFQSSEVDMKIISVSRSPEKMKNSIDIKDNIFNDQYCRRMTNVFQPSGEVMEIRSISPLAEQVINPNGLSAALSTVIDSKDDSKQKTEDLNAVATAPQQIFDIENITELPLQRTQMISSRTNFEEQSRNMEKDVLLKTICDLPNRKDIIIDEKTFDVVVDSVILTPHNIEHNVQKENVEQEVQDKENVRHDVNKNIFEESIPNMKCPVVSQAVEKVLSSLDQNDFSVDNKNLSEVQDNSDSQSPKQDIPKEVSALKDTDSFIQFLADNKKVNIKKNVPSLTKEALETIYSPENYSKNLQTLVTKNFPFNTSEAKQDTNFITFPRYKNVALSNCIKSAELLSPSSNLVDKFQKYNSKSVKESENLDTFNVESVDEVVTESKEKVAYKNIKIVYSEPIKIDSRISEPDQISTTPTSSFYRRYHNPLNEDTQQLINATLSHPESFKLELSGRIMKQANEENRDNDSFKQKKLDEIGQTYILRDSSSSSRTNDCSMEVICDDSLFADRSIDLVGDKFDASVLELCGTKGPSSPSRDDDRSIRNSDYHDYTIRSTKLLENIQKYLITPSEEEITRKKKRKERILKLFQDYRDKYEKLTGLLKKFELPQVKLVLLEDLLKTERDDSTSSNGSIENNIMEQETNRDSVENLLPPKTLHERVCDAYERSKKYWKFVKAENDYYCFYTLSGTVPFKVHIHPELGLVYSVESYYNTGDRSKPIAFYNAEIVHQKLKKENLLASLGPKYDIFTLLDYVSMTVQEICDFGNEFSHLCIKYQKYQLAIDKEFRITFQLLNLKYLIWWNITVKLLTTNIGCPVDISAVEEMGENVNDDHIKRLVQNTPTGVHFVAKLIENIEEYVQRMGKKIKFK